MAERSVVLRWGAVSLVLGALGIAGFRMAHGDLPAADPAAALEFLSGHGFYTGVHLGAILGVLAWCGGLIALVGTLSDSGARQLARVGTGLMLVGAAIFITDFSIDGSPRPGWPRRGRRRRRARRARSCSPPVRCSRCCGAPR